MNLTGRFIIDGYDLYEAFKVVVQEAQGLDVLPKVKKRTERDWPEESGVDVDTTTDLTYEAHDITLDCYVQESTYADAVKRINGVVKLLSSDGYHLLGSQLRQKLYPVLLQEVIGYKRITPASASAVYVQFTLKLRCPLPETRIGNATVEANEEVTLVIPTAKDFTVWWGDGTVNENTLTHTYTEAGTYTVLIAGTGVTSVVITGINIAEFSYPATGDITHVDVSHTSEEVWKDFNAHAAATTNPHATNVTQEFADTQITPLAVEATYTPTVWSYLVGLFTTVPKSVKEHIIKSWNVQQDLSSRVTSLESDIRDFSLTVPQNVSAVELTNLNIPKGSTILLTIDWVYHADVPAAVYRLEFNDVVTGYLNTGNSATQYVYLYAPLSETGQSQAVIMFADTLTAMTMNIRKALATTPASVINLMASRPSFPDSIINTIRLRTAEAGKVIAAGTKVTVKVIK